MRMQLVQRLQAITEPTDLCNADLNAALEAVGSTDALLEVLALLERFLLATQDNELSCLTTLSEYVERCSRDEQIDRVAISAEVAGSLRRVPCNELLELLLKITAPARAASLLLGIVSDPSTEPASRRMLACGLAKLVEDHGERIDSGARVAINLGLADAFEPVIPFMHTPQDLCESYRFQRHDPEEGEFYQEELWLHAGGFTYVDRWVGCNDACRDTRGGSWCIWLTAPGRRARADFLERFGSVSIAPQGVEPFPDYDATDALVELIATTSSCQETHMDPQDANVVSEQMSKVAPGVLMRVYVHRESGLLALDCESGLLTRYAEDDEDDDWLLY